MSTQPIPLSKLKLSEHNVRHPGEGDPALAVHDLQASILAHGLMTPLHVHALKKPRGHYGVHAGGRRLRALQGLAADGRIEADRAIDCYVSDAPAADLTDASLAENLVRVALKETAEFEAFAALARAGMDEHEIAARYAVTVIHVRQRMRLGRLHPEILAALDDRRITLDLAKAYAATEDQALQARVFGELSQGWQHYPHNVRNAIRGGSAAVDADRMLAVVGRQPYLDAGGQIETDLFTDHVRVLQLGTLQDLYYARLAEQEAALAAQLPEGVTLTTSDVGAGAPVFAGATLTDAQRDRLQAIDERCEAIGGEIEDSADWAEPEDGSDPVLVADVADDQARVDALAQEMDALEAEAEAIHAAATPELPAGPVVARWEATAQGPRLVGYHRPAGWRPDGAAAAPAAAVAPEAQAKAETGLTNDAAATMQSHRRAILRGAMLGDHMDIGHRFLLFTLARLALNGDAVKVKGGARGYHHDYPSSLGVAGGLAATADPVAANEVDAQPGGRRWLDDRDMLAGRPWMQERDPARALTLFLAAKDDEVEHVGALLGAHLLDRSLQAAGMKRAVHDAVAGVMGLDDATVRRRYWRPDEAYFGWLSKARRIAAVEEVSPRAAKAIARLPTAAIAAACARFFVGDEAALKEFGLVEAEARYARMWMPAYLRFDEGDPPWVVARGSTKALELQAERDATVARIEAMEPRPAVIAINGRAWFAEGAAWSSHAPDEPLQFKGGHSAVINRFLWLARLLQEVKLTDVVETFATLADYRAVVPVVAAEEMTS